MFSMRYVPARLRHARIAAPKIPCLRSVGRLPAFVLHPRAASVHQVRSSAKRAKDFSSAAPASPVGLPCSSSVCATDPTATGWR